MLTKGRLGPEICDEMSCNNNNNSLQSATCHFTPMLLEETVYHLYITFILYS